MYKSHIFIINYIRAEQAFTAAVEMTVDSAISAALGNKTISQISDILGHCRYFIKLCFNLNFLYLHGYTFERTSIRVHGGKNLMQKVRWVIIALFAPELVVWSAVSQRQAESELVRNLNRTRFGDDYKNFKSENVSQYNSPFQACSNTRHDQQYFSTYSHSRVSTFLSPTWVLHGPHIRRHFQQR